MATRMNSEDVTWDLEPAKFTFDNVWNAVENMRYKEKWMTIEEQIQYIGGQISDAREEACPRGLYSKKGWDSGAKKINPAVNDVLLALLDLLELEPILTPDEKVELRGKKDAE